MTHATSIGLLTPLAALCIADALRTWGWIAAVVLVGAIGIGYGLHLICDAAEDTLRVSEDIDQ